MKDALREVIWPSRMILEQTEAKLLEHETWFKIHTNVSNFETTFPKTI